MLTVENLSLTKNNNEIFSNVGFSLFLGAAMVITGKNGSGKTSLLKILAGISKESSGKITWGEVEIDKMRADFSGDMQYIGHKNFMKDDLTVMENLEFYTSFYDSKVLIPSALNFFKIADLADEKLKNLSKGTRQKVLLCKLMACPSTLWILDEPDANLDESSKRLLAGLIKTKTENQGMVILSSHQPDLYEGAAVYEID